MWVSFLERDCHGTSDGTKIDNGSVSERGNTAVLLALGRILSGGSIQQYDLPKRYALALKGFPVFVEHFHKFDQALNADSSLDEGGYHGVSDFGL
jgi:hypothetical protein